MGLSKTDSKALSTQAADMSEAALMCRDVGHVWDHWKVFRAVDGYEQTMQCKRCTTERTRFLDRQGYLVGGSRYVYPAGYLLSGLGFMSQDHRAELRMELINRSLER